MNISRMFANAIVRRAAYVIVALVVAFLVQVFQPARAEHCGVPDRNTAGAAAGISTTYQYEGEARAACESMGKWHGNVSGGNAPHYDPQGCQAVTSPPLNRFQMHGDSGGKHVRASCAVYDQSLARTDTATGWTWSTPGCPPGQTWSDSLKRCFDASECLARNGAENGMPLVPVAKPFRDKCVAGCALSMEAGSGSCTVVQFPGDSQTHCNGVFQYTGQVCEASPPGDDDTGPEPEQDSCTPTGPNSGTKFCKKKDGRECFESNSGAMICWGVGETGQRSTGSDAQTRGPGNTEPSPDPPTPPESFDPAKKGDPVTTTTTSDNPNGSTTTTTTTVINNSTTNGTNAPGTPGSNPGQGGGGSEDGDEDGNSASGGGSCEEPPVVDGDAALGMIARQSWETRCALEKIGKGSTVSGDVGDCDSPFTVEGDDANAQRLRAMREQICPGGAEAGAGDGNNIDWSGLDGPDSAEGTAFFGEDVVIGEDGLDTSGLGFSRSCPIIPPVTVFGQVIQFDNSVMCDWLELGGTILLILSALLSVRIMSGVGT